MAENVERVCETCGGSFTPKYKHRPGRYCSLPCYYESGQPRGLPKQRVKNQHMRAAKGHPIAPPSGMVAVSRLVLYEKIGSGPHACLWCGEEVDWKTGLVPGALIADHLNWDRNDDRPENLVPACNPCNVNRQRANETRAITDEDLTMIWGGYRTRAVQRGCEYCGAEFLTVPAEVRKGKGRFCSRSCARRKPRAS